MENSACAVNEFNDVTAGVLNAKAPFCSLLLTGKEVKWRGRINLKTEEEN